MFFLMGVCLLDWAPESQSALQAAMQLRSGDVGQKWKAAIFLGQQSKTPWIAIPALISGLNDPDSAVRRYSLSGFRRFADDPRVGAAVRARIAVERDYLVLDGLFGVLGCTGKTAIPFVCDQLHGANVLHAIETLLEMRADPTVVVPHLLREYRASEPGYVRLQLILALVQLSPQFSEGDREVVRAIRQEKEEAIRLHYAVAFAKAGARAAPVVVPVLVDLLPTNDPWVKGCDILAALADLGSSAKAALPTLRALLRTTKEPELFAAVILAIAPDDREARQIVCGGLFGLWMWQRHEALGALVFRTVVHLKQAALPLLPQIEKELGLARRRQDTKEIANLSAYLEVLSKGKRQR